MKRVMLDLETMGVQKNAVILSIGAVEFTEKQVLDTAQYYQNIDPDSCVDLGLTFDQGTVEFWGRSEQATARQMLQENMVSVREALMGFRSWMLRDENHDQIEVWCNGMFDLPILETAYFFAG